MPRSLDLLFHLFILWFLTRPYAGVHAISHGDFELIPKTYDDVYNMKYGQSVCISNDGQTIFLGANGYRKYKGLVHIYQLQQGKSGVDSVHWKESYIEGSNTVEAEEKKPGELRMVEKGSGFGFACALDAAARNVLITAPGHKYQRGRVYIFHYREPTKKRASSSSSSSSSEITFDSPYVEDSQILEIADGKSGDYFGWDIAASANGDTVAISAKGRTSNNGALFLYKCQSGFFSCTFIGILEPPDYTDVAGPRGIRIRNNFGISVTMNAKGNIIAAGSTGYQAEQGCVYVFEEEFSETSDHHWRFKQRLESAHPQKYGYFGFKVSMDDEGENLVVGADGEDDYRGAAYVFHRKKGTEEFSDPQTIYLPKREVEDNFGGSVHFSGDGKLLLIGAPGIPCETPGEGTDCGALFIFENVANTWEVSMQVQRQTHRSRKEDLFAWAIGASHDGKRFIVSAPEARSGGFAIVGSYKRSGKRNPDTASLMNDDIVTYYGSTKKESDDVKDEL